MRASEVHPPRVRDCVPQKKAQGREVRKIHCDTRDERLLAGLPVRVGLHIHTGIILKQPVCDSVMDRIDLRRSRTAEAGTNTG